MLLEHTREGAKMHKYKFCPLCGQRLLPGIFSNKKRSYCCKCHYIRYENPLPSAAAIAQLNGQILLIKRSVNPGKGLWTLPAGFIEAGETPEQACLRELYEETAMRGEVVALINAYHEYADVYGDILNLIYYVELCPGSPQAGDDVEAVCFVPLAKVGDLGFHCFNLGFQQFRNLNL